MFLPIGSNSGLDSDQCGRALDLLFYVGRSNRPSVSFSSILKAASPAAGGLFSWSQNPDGLCSGGIGFNHISVLIIFKSVF
jgi:hypothetical protein